LSESNVFWCGTFLSAKNIRNWLNGTKYGIDWE
jgi:hypothetical protein